jgi:hypothetical protein
MNAIVPQATNPRFSRIRKISRLLKIAVLICVFVPLCVVAFNLKFPPLASTMVSILDHTYAKPAAPDVSLLATKGGLLSLYASQAAIPFLTDAFATLGAGLCLLGIVSFYRLLGLYEKGVIFSAANVAEMKKLAGYLIVYGLLGFADNAVYAGGIFLPWSLLGPRLPVDRRRRSRLRGRLDHGRRPENPGGTGIDRLTAPPTFYECESKHR